MHLSGRLAHHALGLRVSLAADVDDLVTLAGEVGDQLVGPHHVRTGGVDRRQASFHCTLLDLWRHPVRGEDHRSVLDLFEARQPIGRIDQGDSLRLQVVGRVRVVHEHAQHVHRAVGLLAHPLCDSERIDHAMAVTARRDPDDFHG